MPRGDGTGPQGQGARTGRGQGRCAPKGGTPAPRRNSDMGNSRGQGQGTGRSAGRGLGKGKGAGQGRGNR